MRQKDVFKGPFSNLVGAKRIVDKLLGFIIGLEKNKINRSKGLGKAIWKTCVYKLTSVGPLEREANQTYCPIHGSLAEILALYWQSCEVRGFQNAEFRN